MVPLDNSYIGIAVSIAGNVLISVSLNTQKLAHKRLSEEQHGQSNNIESNKQVKSNGKSRSAQHQTERTPLLPTSKKPKSQSQSTSKRHNLAVYAIEPSNKDTDSGDSFDASQRQEDDTLVIRELPHPAEIVRDLAENRTELAVQDGTNGRIRRKWLDIRKPKQKTTASHMNGNSISDSRPNPPERNASRSSNIQTKATSRHKEKAAESGSSFYASKLWWLGLCLMALGELGNFTSYAFAPASVVAPLGTTALIANCFIAPLMLHERFRKKDIVGIGFSIIGAVTIVLSSKSENKSLTPHQFIRAVSQPAFIVYAFISLGLIVAGDKYLAIDILICALCGGFTVLSVKAFSSFLTQDFVECFRQWPTYPVLGVLAATAIMQIIFLNKALRSFESRVVVPTQFVSFTISAITGSAILYRDFEDVQLGKVVAFFLGIVLVFVGVVFLTSSKHTDTEQTSGGDISQSTAATQYDANDSQISTSSIDSEGRLLEGVAITSRPPATAAQTLSYSPRKVGRVLRKYNSISMLPSRARNSSTAVATPIRSARTPQLATSKLFSPGYLLIAGSGFGSMNIDDNEDGNTIEELGQDLESGLRRESSGSSRSNSGSVKNIQRGGQETLMDDGGITARPPQNGGVAQDSEDDDCEPMNRSALMRRSGTV